jgi:hypothetical protein
MALDKGAEQFCAFQVSDKLLKWKQGGIAQGKSG